MKLKKRVDIRKHLRKMKADPTKPFSPEDTAARVKAVLSQLSGKDYVVLALAESDSGGDPYEIRLGGNGSVYCTCKGWQYDKTGKGCKHLTRYRAQVRPIKVKKEA